jgi:hypothetical protein
MEWVKPYCVETNNKRVTNLKHLRKSTGVYFIRELGSKKLVYVGMSRSCLYKALYRHFQDWSSSKQYRVTYYHDRYEVKVILIRKHKVRYYERRLISYFNPLDNRKDKRDSVECPF